LPVSPAERFEPGSRPTLAQERLQIVLVEAYVRSGSTLLGRVLGEIPGFIHLGELGNIWLHGVKENDLCGCGVHFYECAFWIEVGNEAFGGWHRVDTERVLDLDRLSKQRFFPLVLASYLWPWTARRVQEYSDYLSILYLAIRKVSGCPVIVDSKKSPTYALIVRKLAGVDLKMVHLVRDPRGVAYSMTKRVRRPEATTQAEFLRRLPPAVTALTWAANNMVFQLMSRLGTTTFARYESMVATPRPELARLLRELDLKVPEEDFGFIDTGEVNLSREHTVSGNPMRFNDGAVTLKIDDEWRTGLSRKSRFWVALITWPLLLRYGYAKRLPQPAS